MPFASSTTTASGSTPTFAVPFPYLSKADVHVTVDGVLQTDSLLVWPTSSTVTLPATPTAGGSVKVYRSTPLDSLAAQVVDGAFLDDTDINKALTQTLYIAQELTDQGSASATELATIIDFVNNAMTTAAASATAAAASAVIVGTEATAAANSAAAAAASAVLAASYSGTSQAPADVAYLVQASNGALSAERVVTDGTFVSWDWSTSGVVEATLVDASITLAKLSAAAFADAAEAEVGTENTKIMTALRVFEGIAAYLAANPPATDTPQVGSLRPTHATAAQSGWVLWSDGTIGDGSSNATARANADTSALFDLYYTYSDAQCPLFTSAGGATTRGVQGSAATAYAAHCAIRFPKGAGRFVGVAGSGSGLTTRSSSDTVGAETLTQTTAQLPPHDHPLWVPSVGGPSGPTLDNALTNVSSVDAGPMGVTPVDATEAHGDIGTGKVIGLTGGGNPMSIMPPGAYANWEVKL